MEAENETAGTVSYPRTNHNVGDYVIILARSWPGINKPEAAAKIKEINCDSGNISAIKLFLAIF